VLKGELQVETRIAVHEVLAGQAIVIHAGEWVRYSAPGGSREETVRGFAQAMSQISKFLKAAKLRPASLLKTA
jgi:hypothetical protein